MKLTEFQQILDKNEIFVSNRTDLLGGRAQFTTHGHSAGLLAMQEVNNIILDKIEKYVLASDKPDAKLLTELNKLRVK